MERSGTQTVDVRDMLCAQALAVVAQAMAPLPPGGVAAVRYSTEDVRRDLVAWATGRGYGVCETADASIQFEKR